MQDTHEQLGKKNQELADLYRDKCKKFTQITNLYNLLKTRAMRSQMQTAASDSVSQALRSLAPPQAEPHHAMPPLSNTNTVRGPPPQTPSARQQSAFPVDTEGVEQLHRHQRSGTGSSRGPKRRAAVSAMAPPSRPVGPIRSTLFPGSSTLWDNMRLMSARRYAPGDATTPHAPNGPPSGVTSFDGTVAVATGQSHVRTVPGGNRYGSSGMRWPGLYACSF